MRPYQAWGIDRMIPLMEEIPCSKEDWRSDLCWGGAQDPVTEYPLSEHQHPLVLGMDITRGIEQDLAEPREPDVKDSV